MPRGKGIYDEENDPAAKEPADHERDAGTTGQDETPDVAETGQEPTA